MKYLDYTPPYLRVIYVEISHVMCSSDNKTERLIFSDDEVDF